MMKKFLIILFCLTSLKTHSLEITLSQGTVKPTPIAVTNLFSNNSTLDKLGKNIASVISDNLQRSGLFIPINQKAFIQSSESLSDQPRFEDWKVIKAQHLVSGKIETNNNKISIEFRLFDVFAQKQIVGKKYETSKNNWRRVAHIISDAIFQRITGEGGFFDTRIVYVAETGPKDNRQKRLAIMDQDQANHRFLTDGSYLVLTPRFSPNSQKITFMSYVKANSPRVFIFDIETGQQEIVGEFPGMTFAPRFSPDGKKIVMSYSDPDVGNSEIYILDLQTRSTERITNNSGIDVSGSFSPDGKNIVFNSDRTGRRHIYIIDNKGKNLRRISREAGSYYTPVWSPRGDMIAFTKQEGGQFYIGVMEIDGSNERMIAKSFHVEGPTWSPNGRYLMYFKEERSSSDGTGGESSLYSIDLTGYTERKIITPLGGSDPAWSPLMH
ncbi:MAG: Tol-Pal system protein TolB [Pelagibacteraceae bacterium]|nr:Tol-Pal system protein TolB [Pelagibacteraceae bacterium]MBT4645033.1 Tol-Pal system protein TolB [Pelagibacteraceae bacterium]MBT4950921.1 Tol-Pal system protein TolB [Pelagibacteraceae bacterium]